MRTKRPMIFKGIFSDTWYVTWQYEELGEGTFRVNGEKYDVTDQIEAIIATALASDGEPT